MYCFTLRDNTERPITLSQGTNILVGTDIKYLIKHLNDFTNGIRKKGKIPYLWDGMSGERIANIINKKIE